MRECVKMYWIVLLCACASARAYEDADSNSWLLVNTTEGVVRGRVADENYLEFHGIPYAGSTSGENRFKAPTPPPKFSGVFEAINTNITCAHPTAGGLVGIEDCLTVNIFTNNLETSLPVLVFIHEEDFGTWNTGIYSYARLVASNLVVVTLNYRLSIFGFLCLKVAEAPGNAGLRDIVQGLKWIQDNIAGFGGDPNNVAIMGHGSGAAMVDLVTLSPIAAGLVHSAIAFSGTALAPWAVGYDPVGHAMVFGNKLGYNTSIEELGELLTTADPNVLATAIREFQFPNNTVLFGPCVEDVDLNPNNTFLADAPINILRSGDYLHIPYIAAITDLEGTIRAEQAVYHNWLQMMQTNLAEFIPLDLNFNNAEMKTAIVESIRDFYFAEENIDMSTIQGYLNYHGDTTIKMPVIRYVRQRALTSRAAVRLMEFSYLGGTDDSDWPFAQIPLRGAKHGSLLNYAFDFNVMPHAEIARNILIRRISQFARTGNPNFDSMQTATWNPLSRAGPVNVLSIEGREETPIKSIYSEHMRITNNIRQTNLWDPIYANFYVPPNAISSAGKLMYFMFLIAFSLIVHGLL